MASSANAHSRNLLSITASGSCPHAPSRTSRGGCRTSRISGGLGGQHARCSRTAAPTRPVDVQAGGRWTVNGAATAAGGETVCRRRVGLAVSTLVGRRRAGRRIASFPCLFGSFFFPFPRGRPTHTTAPPKAPPPPPSAPSPPVATSQRGSFFPLLPYSAIMLTSRLP